VQRAPSCLAGTQFRVLPKWGLGISLISLIPYLGDALQAIGILKNIVRASKSLARATICCRLEFASIVSLKQPETGQIKLNKVSVYIITIMLTIEDLNGYLRIVTILLNAQLNARFEPC
jgi:hypothetical protein